MHAPYEVPRVSGQPAPPADADVDLFIIPVAQDHAAAAVAATTARWASDLRSALEREEFRAKTSEVYVARKSASGWRAARIVFVGGGPRSEINAEHFRRMAVDRGAGGAGTSDARASAGPISNPARLPRPRASKPLPRVSRSPTSTTAFTRARTITQFFISEGVDLHLATSAGAAAAAGGAMGESINAARVLINEPGNYLTPRVLADKAAALASVPGITAEILDETTIEELGMGLLLGVARGSIEPPRMLVLQATSPRARQRARRWASSARASRSTPAVCRSSRPTAWSA